MKKPEPINRDLGTKKSCIADLRRVINQATQHLDAGQLHSALYTLRTGIDEVSTKLPREKITKPFKH